MTMSLTRFLQAALLVASVAAQNFSINTPPQQQAQQCEPLQISWMGGTAPYFIQSTPIAVSVQNDPITSTPYVNFGQQSNMQVTWQAVNATIGETFILQAKDNTGVTVSSANFTVVTGTGDSCLSSGGGSGPGNSNSGSSTSPTSTSSGSGSQSGTSSKTSTSPTTSKSGSGAEKQQQQTAGVVGLFVGVLFVLALQQ
ncbi:hypothetical protein HMN09_00559400 [Mycena chlorophos]|uniref:Uncharacterized protein n=1 Tax=Mycena chlorophos TaxID=658473 RepID=A0A8H6WCV3_MYCCL|nr:hypothetical protein HMN09_00559400 [Mycena chlorophos]